jgi:hypothetical protein
MRRYTVAAWIGISIVLGTGISLLLRTKLGVGAELANTSISGGRETSEVRQQIATEGSVQPPGQEQSGEGAVGRVRRTAVSSSGFAELPLPPVPSRVLPGHTFQSEQRSPGQLGHSLPSPPAPSKTLPDTIPGRSVHGPNGPDENALSELN